ncbi:flavodoxin-dependent (E)-4-hydroxy-3-methylbut-2-enyl-diphosphate synthase, partial [Enterobacter hormaechei]|nr:flavodoxin-dependent (E)-4-hydroxy-3-methylbut-2-enyl-diphosphate synthase [Enterobacter hormaechei]
PQVMVQAYRLLIQQMDAEFGECYPLHLGVTEAGDGEDGRVKSAAGIGTLLEDGVGDTIRVSLTEDPEFEIPVCKDLVKRYASATSVGTGIPAIEKIPYDPFSYQRRECFEVGNIGGKQVPVVVADLSKVDKITPAVLESIGYRYDEKLDKWNISDTAADYVFTGHQLLDFALPGMLKVIVYAGAWAMAADKEKYFPVYNASGFVSAENKHSKNFVMLDCFSDETPINNFSHLDELANDPSVILCFSSSRQHAM